MLQQEPENCEGNSTNNGQGCEYKSSSGTGLEDEEWMEEVIWNGMRRWHVFFLSAGTVLSFVILLCCCFKFRIPRTKQEIEGDYVRRRIMRKFRKRLKAIQNQELDEMDLKKALDKIRTELKSDTESLQQSDVLSGATLSSAGVGGGIGGSTYRRASQIQIDISLEDLRIQSLGMGARIALAFNRFFGRNGKPSKEQNVEGGGGNDANGAGQQDGNDHPTTALIPKEETSKKGVEIVDASDKKVKVSKSKDKDREPTAKSSKGESQDPKGTKTVKDKKSAEEDKKGKASDGPKTEITTETEKGKPKKKNAKEKEGNGK